MRRTLRTPSLPLELLLLLLLCSAPISTSPLPLSLYNLSPRSLDDDDDFDDEDVDPNDRDGDGRLDDMESMPPRIVALIAVCVLILVLAVVFGYLWFLRVRRRRLELAAGSMAKDNNNNNVSRWSLRKSTTATTTAVNSAAPSVRGEKSRCGSREGGAAGILSRRGSAGGGTATPGGAAGKVEEDEELEIDAEDVMSCSWCYIAKDGLCRWCREAMEASELNAVTPNVVPISSETSSATVGVVVWNTEGEEKGKGKAPATKSVELSPLSAPLVLETGLVPGATLMPLMPLEPVALLGGRSEEVDMFGIGGDNEVVRRPVVKHSFAAGKGVYSIA